ncbi:ATPase/GTPase, AAA15 family [Rhodoblastus acidophilus]|uniref:ATPase/GTPase, AAA15 family n=1 Tax=Rhodoblastus acidophilus TaxID=1074 RepID=A0A212QIM8_RHOAC|nr:ATPase/GTPase, AAA15 family [Rhodoblastus acidophilus]
MQLRTVRFRNFKGLRNYQISFRHINVLVGPNNAGKSSVLDAFRLLGAALRYARRRNPTVIARESSSIFGWEVPVSTLPISLVNVHSDANYDSVEETSISFEFTNGSQIRILLIDSARCLMTVETNGARVTTTSQFKARFPVEIYAFPTLGPIEEEEEWLTDEYVERHRSGRRSHRMFRNVWFRQRELFSTFKKMVEESWLGVTISEPVRYGVAPPRLEMFFTEARRAREVSWAGFGFQVWLQLLTHLVSATTSTALIVDEPEIYLHPDLQRRLFELLRRTGKQIILATHSAEIVNDAERDEVVLVDRGRRAAKRIGEIEGLQEALFSIGSAQNIHLTKLSRGRRVLFFEGQDYKLLRRFASQLGYEALADGGDVTVVPIGGFAQRQRIEDAAWTFGQVLKAEIAIAALLDRDYRSIEEINEIVAGIRSVVPRFHVLGSKEIENYLLVPHAIAKAVEARLRDRPAELEKFAASGESTIFRLLEEITASMRTDVQSQVVGHRIRYFAKSGKDISTLTKEAITFLDPIWENKKMRFGAVPGKQTFAELNTRLQNDLHVSITAIQIVSHIRRADIPDEFNTILEDLNDFARSLSTR